MSHRYELIQLCHEILMGNLNIDYAYVKDVLVNGSVDGMGDGGQARVDRPGERLREDDLIVQSIRTLSLLSIDVMSFVRYCEALDLVSMISHELYLHADKYPAPVIELYLNMIDNIASAPTSPYLTQHMQLLRRPLLIACYDYPIYEPLVRNCLWMISDIYSGLDERLLLHRMPFSPLVECDGIVDEHGDSVYPGVCNIHTNQTEHSVRDGDGIHLPAVTSTGRSSKRLTRTGVSDRFLKQATLDPSVCDDNVCEISRLSAKSKKFQEFVDNRKVSYGFKARPNRPSKDHDAMKVAKLDPIGQGPTESIGVIKRIVESNMNAADAGMMVVCVEDIPELSLTRPAPTSRKS